MPTPASCVDCMQDGPVEQPAVWVKEGRAFTSRYPGTCRACGRHHDAGRTVQRWARRKGQRLLETVYVPVECGSPAG